MSNDLCDFIRSIYPNKEVIALHEPYFFGEEKNMLCEAIDTTMVSTIGPFVEKCEQEIAKFTGVAYAVAMSNGTSALHIALLCAGVKKDDLVITQSLGFVATCNAISYCNADPVFVDIDRDSLSLSPEKLALWLEENTQTIDGVCVENTTKRRVSACLPIYILGHSIRSDALKTICDKHCLKLVEDAAEAVGSHDEHGKHAGMDSTVSALSFNGNKIITSGGGGMLITNNPTIAKQAKHLSTTAKINNSDMIAHDEIGYNYRMPNLNAALLYAQLLHVKEILKAKRLLAEKYHDFCQKHGLHSLKQREGTLANYWLNAIACDSAEECKNTLKYLNDHKIMARPIWQPMHLSRMFTHALRSPDLSNTLWAYEHIVCLPSSITKKLLEG